jgi:hypothetical protein
VVKRPRPRQPANHPSLKIKREKVQGRIEVRNVSSNNEEDLW